MAAKTKAPPPLVQMVAMKSIAVRPGNRDKHDKGELKKLSASIDKVGLLQPIVVRPVKGGYELVAGERRFLACQELKWKEIQANVIDCADDLAEVARLAENLERLDLSPYEMARQLEQVKAKMPDARVEDLAKLFGRSTEWVAQRLGIGRLGKKLRAMLEKADAPLSVVEVFARADPAVHDALAEEVEEYVNDQWDNERLTRTTAERIVEEYQHSMERVKWDRDDATLIPDRPACSQCPSRASQQQALFPDLAKQKHDTCLNKTCYAAKADAYLALSIEKVKALAEKNGTKPIFLGYSRPDGERTLAALGEASVQDSYKFTEGKKSDKGAIPALHVGGYREDLGKVVWLKPEKKVDHRSGKKREIDQTTGKVVAASPKEKVDLLKKKRKCRAVELWMDRLNDVVHLYVQPVEILRFAIAFGTEHKQDGRFENEYHNKGWKKGFKPTAGLDEAGLIPLLWKDLVPVLQQRCRRSDAIERQAEDLWKEAEKQAAAIGAEPGKEYDPDTLAHVLAEGPLPTQTLGQQALATCYADAVKEIPMGKGLAATGVQDPDLPALEEKIVLKAKKVERKVRSKQ